MLSIKQMALVSAAMSGSLVLSAVASPTEPGTRIKNPSQQVLLDVQAVNGILKADEKQSTWIRVGLTGFQMDPAKKRAPINVALVLDKSGSMQGKKIARAREAAISAIDRLAPNDIVSIITYDSTVNVLVPSTKLTDKEMVKKAIRQIRPGGNTALFAGVSKGAAEIRKFMSKEHVNRVVLLSDGKANEGPSSPTELGALGRSLKKENISVSTLGLGLGYNEDLMVALADNAGGNHEFIEDAVELAEIFNREFDDVMSVVAQEVDVTITVPEGIRPVRVLGNSAEITGQKIVTRLTQIYSEQDKHLVLELEVPPTATDSKRNLADVSVTYHNMKSSANDKLSGNVKVAFSNDKNSCAKSLNGQVMENVVALLASEQSKLATDYLDRGEMMKCISTLKSNSDFLQENALKFKSDRLRALLTTNEAVRLTIEKAPSASSRDAISARKSARALQNQVDNQLRVYSSKKASGALNPAGSDKPAGGAKPAGDAQSTGSAPPAGSAKPTPSPSK